MRLLQWLRESLPIILGLAWFYLAIHVFINPPRTVYYQGHAYEAERYCQQLAYPNVFNDNAFESIYVQRACLAQSEINLRKLALDVVVMGMLAGGAMWIFTNTEYKH